MTPVVSVEVPSATSPDTFYVVARVNGFAVCTCKGFEYRGRCKHLAFAPTATDELEACGICDQVHDCHCPRLQAWCVRCTPEVA